MQASRGLADIRLSQSSGGVGERDGTPALDPFQRPASSVLNNGDRESEKQNAAESRRCGETVVTEGIVTLTSR